MNHDSHRGTEGVLDVLRPALVAAAVALVVVGALILLTQPPSLAGAGTLLALVAGAGLLIFGAAWVTVRMIGRDAPSEAAVERLVRRSEQLARSPLPATLDDSQFAELARDAIDRLPPDFQRLLEATPVVVSDRGAEVGAYGHYFGDTVVHGNYERRIVLYRDTLERDFGHDPELLAAQVERTLRHELAHHLGWREHGVRSLGL